MKRTVTIIALTLAILLNVSSTLAHRWCWNSNQNNTYGWQLMTPEERKEHQGKLAGFSDYSACKEYVANHHKTMAERARENSVELPAMEINPCDAMKAKGTVK